jgi:zinc finger SWIM domain-containing protein 3
VVPEVGMTMFESEEDAYEIYNTYAGKVWPGVRKSDTKSRADKAKLLACSKQGFGTTRTRLQCYNSVWCQQRRGLDILNILPKHNHYLTSPNKLCKLRSRPHVIEVYTLLIAQTRDETITSVWIHKVTLCCC